MKKLHNNRSYMFLEYLIRKKMFFSNWLSRTCIQKLEINWIKVFISTDELSRNIIFHQYLYLRLINKNSSKVSKDIFIFKLKDNFLIFSMLLTKASKFRIYKKKSKIRALLEKLFKFNKKTILKEFMIL